MSARRAAWWDVHCHTEFAHCATTVDAASAVAAGRAAGLGGTVLTEHAFALYVPDPDEAWRWRWKFDPEFLRPPTPAGRDRLARYLARVRALRGGDVLLGLEMDWLADGRLCVAPGDEDAWDVRLGSVHVLSDRDRALDDAGAKRRFMAEVEGITGAGVDVLAHPFRWFVWGQRPAPTELYPPVADLCRRHGVAAELNFHGGNVNDPAFFRLCLDRGVRLALGTDAHAREEAADLAPHAAFLAALGLGERDWSDVLYRPVPRARAPSPPKTPPDPS